MTTMMGFPTQKLQPYTLYITVSVPENPPEPPQVVARKYDYEMNGVIEICEKQEAEGTVRYVLGAADFDWGIYWHRDLGDGTWYTYEFCEPAMWKGPPGLYKRWTYRRTDVKQSPRLHRHVVGLVQVMRIPDIGEKITGFLDWLAPLVGSNTRRDDTFATTIYIQTRMFVAHERQIVDKEVEQFDAANLIYRVTHSAYREVWYSFGGHLPRPI
ncbi:hypothetical protein ACHAPO_006355 [Fusarium lateritium]